MASLSNLVAVPDSLSYLIKDRVDPRSIGKTYRDSIGALQRSQYFFQ